MELSYFPKSCRARRRGLIRHVPCPKPSTSNLQQISASSTKFKAEPENFLKRPPSNAETLMKTHESLQRNPNGRGEERSTAPEKYILTRKSRPGLTASAHGNERENAEYVIPATGKPRREAWNCSVRRSSSCRAPSPGVYISIDTRVIGASTVELAR